ncbi:MAG: VWA domain-containing protein [Deltaproteobacteria bacterium]|nr:VWA domain-containing protein [Deltaproteobacteria bacterium]
MNIAGTVERALGWEERLFGYAFGRLRALAGGGGRGEPDADRAALLATHAARLTVLAQVIAERPVRVRESEGEGGLRGPVLLLPRALALGPDVETNASLYVLRTLIGAEMARRELAAAPAALEPARDPLAAHVAHALSARRAQDALAAAMPGFAAGLARAWELARAPLASRRAAPKLTHGEAAWLDWLMALGRPEGAVPEAAVALAELRGAGALPRGALRGWPLWGGPLSPADELVAEAAAATMAEGAEHADGTEHEAPSRDEVRRVLLEKTEEVEPMPVHSFEKAECLDSYRGGQRKVDGDDELDEHLEALSEVDLREVFRGGRDTHSVLRADLDLGGGVPDVERVLPGERGVCYDEWDPRKRRYLRDWVTVYPAAFRATDPAWGARVAREQRRTIDRLLGRIVRERTRLERTGRQLDGEGLDLAAFIEERGLRAAGRSAPGRIYEQRRRRSRDTACSLLLDMSLSAGSWIDDRRVLDLTREAVVVLGEVTAALGDPLQVLGFGSNTRNLCRVWELKAWRDPWPEARHRLGAIEPRGYTRMGAPIRHAVAELLKTRQRHKLLIVLTDGKPTDYDRYEGAHGIGDVRQAVREAARDGVLVHALAYDPSARAQIPAMFGPGASTFVRHTETLAEAVAEAYARRTSRG